MENKKIKFFGRIIGKDNRKAKIVEGFGVYLTSDEEGKPLWQLASFNKDYASVSVQVEQVWAETHDNQVYVISLKKTGE